MRIENECPRQLSRIVKMIDARREREDGTAVALTYRYEWIRMLRAR